MKPVILIGRTVPELGWKIADLFPYSSDPINPQITQFANGEISCKIERNVRDADCFVIQSICKWNEGSVNDALVELLIMVDALKRASAKSITAVIPHLGYARQDRRADPRTPITSKLVANLLQEAGVTQIITMDMHCLQAEGFFDIPVVNLEAMPALLPIVEKRVEGLFSTECCIVSPDAGGMRRARKYAEKLRLPVAMIDKRRTGANQAEVMNIIGNVDDCVCILVDDMIDTGGTTIKAAEALLANGARSVTALCTHPVFSDSAWAKLGTDTLEKTVYGNTLPQHRGSRHTEWLKEVDVAPIFASAISKVVEGKSISEMFK